MEQGRLSRDLKEMKDVNCIELFKKRGTQASKELAQRLQIPSSPTPYSPVPSPSSPIPTAVTAQPARELTSYGYCLPQTLSCFGHRCKSGSYTIMSGTEKVLSTFLMNELTSSSNLCRTECLCSFLIILCIDLFLAVLGVFAARAFLQLR